MPDQRIEILQAPRIAAGIALGGRTSQQDAMLCLVDAAGDACLLVLADGMGGDGAGELASEGVIATARRLWDQGAWRDQPGAVFLESLCQQAHEELHRRREGLQHGEPHSTIVALLLRGKRACWVHVGDSRLYQFIGPKCVERTRDHSLAELRVQRGELRPEEVAQHADQHKLLRGLGGDSAPQVEHGGAMLRRGQGFALCSDGVWEYLTATELGRYAIREDLDHAVHDALSAVLERGGRDGDNAALILVHASPDGRLIRYLSGMWPRLMGGMLAYRRPAVT